MPIAIKNYGLAAIGVSTAQNITAAVVSGIPFCFMWVYIGSTTHSLVEIVEGRRSLSSLDLPPTAMAAGAICTALVCGVGGVYIKRIFNAYLQEAEKVKEQ